MIEIDLGNYPSGTKHAKPKEPIDRDKIRRKHRNAYWAARRLLSKIQRERRQRK